MPKRKTLLIEGEIYHVFNRGVAKMPIFSTSHNYHRLIELIEYYRFSNTPSSFSIFKRLTLEQRNDIHQYLTLENNLHVEIIAFCLMDNHYHLLIKQITNNGITSFISNVQNGYAKYYNTKQNRTGPLFQPMFKAIRIQSDEQLLHVSRYIHLNPSTGYLTNIENLPNYLWSSLSTYIKNSNEFNFVSPNEVLRLIGKKQSYRDFVFDQADYQRELANIKHLALE